MIQHHLKKTLLGLSIFILLVLISFGCYYFGLFGAHLIATETSFTALPDWQQDKQQEALQAFQRSCSAITKLEPEASMNAALPESGKAKDWQPICQAAQTLSKPTSASARQFFETWFKPYHISNNFNHYGLFTGYYLPVLRANLQPSARYSIPIYGLPDDLVKINLGKFKPEFAGTTIIGQLHDHNFYPYPDRKAINNGAIKTQAKVLAWGDNEVDLFFAHVQGSTLIQLPNKQLLLLGYAGTNGQPYTAIGKTLITQKALTKNNISMQAIRAWLLLHPEQMQEVLNQNASYVFFKLLKNTAPLGTQQVPLTPQRSLAVDIKYIPLGAPIWLDTTLPTPEPQRGNTLFRHLLIAQDTGGAIKGIVRGDIYWGTGESATFLAGHMKNPGRYWILLPKQITP